MEDEDLFDDEYQERPTFSSSQVRPNTRLSPVTWRDYGSEFLDIDVKKEIEFIADYIKSEGFAGLEAIGLELDFPLGRVWMATEVLERKGDIKIVAHPLTAIWIGA